MYRNLDNNHIILGDNTMIFTQPYGCTPGLQFRSALANGVTPDLGSSQVMFDDDQNFDSVDPHADIRTDWREYSNRMIDSVEGEPSQSPSSDPSDVPGASHSSMSSPASSD